jgi:hypothetical protein
MKQEAKRAWNRELAEHACCLFHAGFLFGLLFDPEDGSDMFL